VTKKPSDKQTVLFPVCVRFKRKDARLIRAAAAREGEIVTVWIREAVLMRIDLLEDGAAPTPLRFETAGGEGDPMSVRFRADQLRRVTRAASRDQQHLSSWVRAVAVDRAARISAAVPKVLAASA
jgi:uncharacterized protein (DUF1778 family)